MSSIPQVTRGPAQRLQSRLLPRLPVLPEIEAIERVLFTAAAVRRRRMEDAEVARALARLGEPVSARFVTIIPTYRRPQLLDRAVASALRQTVADHHVVVVDDGGRQVPDFDDPRVTVLTLRNNVGVVGVVRNVGIRASESDYVAFLDDDNVWDATHLTDALPALESGATLTYTGMRIVNPTGYTEATIATPFDRRGLRRQNYVDTSTMVARRSPYLLFSRLRRRPGSFRIEDWELIWRLSARGNVVLTPAVSVAYLHHSGSHFSLWDL